VIITTCGNSQKIALRVARQLQALYSPLTISSFPDGDIYLKYNVEVKDKVVVIIHSFQPHPNQSLYQVIFAAETAQDLGAKKVILVAPYLAFMRQDKRFHLGEAISSRIMAKHLNSCLDKIITIDPHLHRYKSLKDIFTIPATCLTANELVAQYIQKHFRQAVIIGPDAESYQWAKAVAKTIGAEATVLQKKRYSSRKVEVEMVYHLEMKGKDVAIVDDIISTGHTIAEAAKKAKKLGAKTVTAIGIHGLFVEDAIVKLKKAGVDRIVTTDCIEHNTNKIDVADLLVKELKK